MNVRFPPLISSFVVGVAAALLTACGTLSTWELDVSRIKGGKADLAGNVYAIAAPLVSEGQTPGLMVGLLLADGTTAFFGYGITGQAEGGAPTPDTLFAVGSLSKGFLAGVTSQMIQEGRLAWNDTLSDLLPPGTELSPDAGRITVDQLASHMSGLPRQPLSIRTLSYFVEYLFTGDNFYRHLDRATIFGDLADFSAPEPSTPVYSNIGYGILGDVLERRTGRSVDAMLAERITGPLGLSRTAFAAESLPGYAERAIGHAGDQPKFIARGRQVPDWRFTPILRGSAALYSSARDLLTFAQAHLGHDNSPLGRALADNLRVRYPRSREAVAAAWFADEVDGLRISYQVGIVAGYTSYLGINQANGTAVVVLQNAFNWDCSVGHKLLLTLAGSGDGEDVHLDQVRRQSVGSAHARKGP
jgi:CubicO group peptidase (beta-lactamase class C family)